MRRLIFCALLTAVVLPATSGCRALGGVVGCDDDADCADVASFAVCGSDGVCVEAPSGP
jgi:hypothetical protein